MKNLFKSVVLLLFLAMVIPTSVYSQRAFTQTQYYNAGVTMSWDFGNVDSTSTYYSDWFDISRFDAQTTYLTALYVVSSGTADTFKCFLEGGIPPFISPSTSSSYTSPMLLDINSTAYFAVGTVSATGLPTQQSITYTTKAPMARWRVSATSTGSGTPTALKLFLYAIVADYVPTAKDYGNVKP